MVKVNKVSSLYELETKCDKSRYGGKFEVRAVKFADGKVTLTTHRQSPTFIFERSDPSVIKAFAEVLKTVNKLEV